jgi:hypothetical protein
MSITVQLGIWIYIAQDPSPRKWIYIAQDISLGRANIAKTQILTRMDMRI